MSTRRLPPSHAPAHGRRRQEGTLPAGPGATDGAAPGQRVGQQARTSAVTEALAETGTTAEDRAKQRRRTEEEHQQFITERREVHRRSRRTVLRSVETRLDDRRGEARRDGARAELRGPSSPAVSRAAGALERCAGYMSRGLASEASFTFASEAAAARRAAETAGPNSSEGRTLETLAGHMELRASALESMPPGHARRLAQALDHAAAGTQARAEATPGLDGRLLASVAMDSAMLAALLEIGAANCEAFLGRGLLRALHRMADLGFELMKKRAVPKLDGLEDAKAARRELKKAVLQVDRAIEEHRVPLHDLASRVGPDLASVAEHDLLRDLWPGLEALSRALVDGDPRAAQRARGELMDRIRCHPQLGAAKDNLQLALPANPKGASDRVASEQMLPALLLNGLMRGQVSNVLAPDNTNPMWQWMKSAAAPPPTGVQLAASEQMVSELFHHGRTSWPAQALGQSEHMLPGSYGWLRTAGQVSQTIQSLTTTGVQPHVTASQANALTSLPPIGPHEKAVLVDKNGVVLVRGDDGPRFHQGHLVDAHGERHYFDTYPLQSGLQRVDYTSATNANARTSRIELELAENRKSVFGPGAMGGAVEGEEAVEAIERDERSPGSGPGPEYEDIAAVAIFTGRSVARGFRGITTRHAARLAADAIDRINRTLPQELQQPHLYLESAMSAAGRLAALGYDNTEAFQDHVKIRLLSIDCNPTASALLVLFALETHGAARAADFLDELDQGASLVAAGTQSAVKLGEDHLRDERLLVDGVLLHRPGVAIIE